MNGLLSLGSMSSGLYLEIGSGLLLLLAPSGLQVEEALLRLALTLSSDWLKGVLRRKADVLLEVGALVEG